MKSLWQSISSSLCVLKPEVHLFSIRPNKNKGDLYTCSFIISSGIRTISYSVSLVNIPKRQDRVLTLTCPTRARRVLRINGPGFEENILHGEPSTPGYVPEGSGASFHGHRE